MHTRIIFPILLAVLSTGWLLTAQTDTKNARDSRQQPKAIDASMVEPGTPLEFSVRGLTKDNVDMVKQGLMSMETRVFMCDGCKHEQPTMGQCPACDVDMKSRQRSVLFEALPSFKDQRIRVTPFAAQTLRYSELEDALTKSSVQIDSSRFPIAGKARLVLLGGTLEDGKSIEKALRDSKLFGTATAKYDAAAGEIQVLVEAGVNPPMRDEIVSTIDGLGTKARLSDVIWQPSTPPSKV